MPSTFLMTTDVVCAKRGFGIEALLAIFLDPRNSAVPVVDDDGAPVGVVSKADLVRHYGTRLDRLLDTFAPCADDLMVPLAFALRMDESVSHAAALMSIEGVCHLPVVDGDRRVIGMLSASSIARWLARRVADGPQTRKRLLLIDGNAHARAAVSDLLHDHGYEVCTASSSDVALGLLHQFDAEVILCDLDLTIVDASALIVAARRGARSAALVWMTVHWPQQGVFGAHVTKPVHFTELLDALDAATRSDR